MRSWASAAVLAGIASLSVAASQVTPDGPSSGFTDYQRLLEWRFSASPSPLPAGGIRWQLDTATWQLDQGEIWAQRPARDGQVTGFVFRGSGRFQMTVPDPIELRQLRRFAEDPHLEALVQDFDALVVRVVGLPWIEDLPPPVGDTHTVHPLARDRHDHWLLFRGLDADSRVIAAMRRPGDIYLRVDMRTRERGWMSYEFDLQRPEEITVEWFNSRFNAGESWLSLDRPEDRTETGRPSGSFEPRIDMVAVDVTADLTRFAKESEQGMSRMRPMNIRFRTQVEFLGTQDGDLAVQFTLAPLAKVERVTDDEGRELEFIRDHRGKRSSVIDNKIYDPSVLVLLSEPLEAGTARRLAFEYEMEAAGFVPGRGWYPSTAPPGTGLQDRHTAHLTLISRDRFGVRAMGSLQSEDESGGLRTTTWTIDEPVKMMSFVFAKRPFEETFQFDGLPEVRAFGSLGGFLTQGRIRQVGGDVVNSLNFFQETFRSPIPQSELQVAVIPAFHGQAFDGLLHIGDFSTGTDDVAAVELFRAHEAAHEWWGHRVGWATYRDQWLSEGFADYSAMMFVEANVKRGDRYFRQMLQAYADELKGSIESAMSQFSRPGVNLLNKRALHRIGPIGHGWRCTVGEAPTAYLSQVYKKGALVLHMVRMMLRGMTGSDEAFLHVMRTYAQRYADRYATTADFEAVLTEVHPADWSWFFDQWVFGAEIPTYLWSYDIQEAEQGYMLSLRVEQRGVHPSFKMAVPVKVEFRQGPDGTVLALVDRPTQDLEFPLPQKPSKVIFNPDNAVLARVKKQ